MATNNLVVRDATGASRTVTMVDSTGSGGAIIPQHCVVDPTLTYTLPTMDAVGRAGYVFVTDGTHTQPTGDAAAREIFVGLADGTTGPAAVKAASTAAAAADKALVVSVSPNSPISGEFLAYGSLPALTTGQSAPLQTDSPGNLKVGVVPLGTPIYNGAASGGAAAATATLTIPSAKMGYLDGFDVDGLGATSGAAIALTITGLLGGTLTYNLGVPAGATVPYHQSFRFNPPLQASAVNTNIVVSAASFGTGNTASSVNAYGRYL